MVVDSGLYIPVSSSIYRSFLDLVNIFPVLVLTLIHEPWYAAFKMCWYKATFVRAVISSNKPFWSTNVLLPCLCSCRCLIVLPIQYCDESFNGANVICRWLFRERVHFYKISSYSWKAYPPFSTTKDRGCFIAPCEWMKKSKTTWFHTNHSQWFLPTRSLSTHNCCTTGMTRTTTSVSTAHLLIFL